MIVPDRDAGAEAVADAPSSGATFGEVARPRAGPRGAQLSRHAARATPYSPEALDTIPRAAREGAGGDGVLVGGPTAQEYDLRESATRDNRLIIPLTLLVVFVILVVLLRALVAPLLLIASVILSFAAALGAGVFVSDVHLRLHRRRTRRCRCWRSSSWSRWGSTTTSS